jgi:hypothetical protein
MVVVPARLPLPSAAYVVLGEVSCAVCACCLRVQACRLVAGLVGAVVALLAVSC